MVIPRFSAITSLILRSLPFGKKAILSLLCMLTVACGPFSSSFRYKTLTIDNRTPIKFIVIINDHSSGILEAGDTYQCTTYPEYKATIQLRYWDVIGLSLYIVSVDVEGNSLRKIIVTQGREDRLWLEYVSY
jgi:hypothetical protein